MRLILRLFPIILALASCGNAQVKDFWDTHSIDYSDYRAAEDQFAEFAEQAVAAPVDDACAALDALFDRLCEDEVAYYIYAEWMDAAFYNLLSPCRNAALYSKAVDRIVSDGILSMDDCEPYLQKREWILYNQVGEKATVPGVSSIDEKTLVLVLDLSCPSCREALTKLGEAREWAGYRHIAVGCGHGTAPDVPLWEFVYPEQADAVFDIHLTPFYFVVAPDGTVTTPYTLAL